MKSFKRIFLAALMTSFLVRMVQAIAPMPEMLNREAMLQKAREITREMAPDILNKTP